MDPKIVMSLVGVLGNVGYLWSMANRKNFVAEKFLGRNPAQKDTGIKILVI